MTAVLDALADPRRREIIDVMARSGQATATTLAAEVDVSRQAIAKHLGVLADAGLVASARQGREVLYVLRPAPLEATARWMKDAAAVWDRRLDALKRAAEES
ncbi:ArsR family transcriptional regulator [Luteipulveratus halotolerans]|uniref:ArsR family transcriptional regulator n=1 Tax=Luteipulveratus halotolerans TaxID=1631356 RepID=A0A0L6CPA6_9MICO|nr:ArsR family transcriptional regulator [Luteipulveratus halotolerans]